MRSIMRIGCLGLMLAGLAVPARSGSTGGEEVKVVFKKVLPNLEAKSMVAVVVNYPPGAKSLPHHHAPSSFIYAYVLSGSIRSQVGDAPAKIYKVGESFYEVPGSHHRISENASTKDPASLLAVFIVDTKDTALTTPDQK